MILTNISFGYKNNNEKQEFHRVFNDFSYEFNNNKINVLIGANGSGKTTLLKLIAGLIKPNTGTVLNNKASKLKTAYVFQNHNDTLLPWFTVYRNLEIINNNPNKIRRYLTDFQLWDKKNKYTYELSGGQQQMLALAKAFAYEAEIMLLDEPFSGLDYNRSRYYWDLFANVWANSKTTVFLVSHSIEEALYLGEEIHLFTSDPENKIQPLLKLQFPKPSGSYWFRTEEYFNARKIIEQIL